jgi:AraC-like DNA-binding protein
MTTAASDFGPFRFSTEALPARDRMAIWVVTMDAGFGDLSYFNRAFRRRYGASPSDVRATARSK